MKKIVMLFCFFTLSMSAISQNVLWAKQIGGPGNEYAHSIASDPFGNFYVLGEYNGSISFGNTILNGIATWNVYLAKYKVDGSLIWAKNIASSTDLFGTGMEIDKAGNCYVSGSFLDNGTFAGTYVAGYGSYDVFIEKLDSAGNLKWVKHGGGTSYDDATDLSMDKIGNLYVTGNIDGNVTFGSVTAAGSQQIFVTKYDTAGTAKWVNIISASVTFGATIIKIEADSAGNSYVTAPFFGTLHTPVGDVYPNGNNIEENFFITKFHTDGSLLWTKTVGAGSGYTASRDIAIDESNNVYVTGRFRGNIKFDNYTLPCGSGSIPNIFIAKYNTSGNFVWAKDAGSSETDEGLSVETDANGNIYITGFYRGTASFGSLSSTSKGGEDAFIAKLGSDGNCSWVKGFGSTDDDFGIDITIDKNNNCYLLGSFNSTITIDDTLFISKGNTDLFIIKIDHITGIRNNDDTPMLFYPNPVQTYSTLVLDNDLEYSKLVIYNELGKIVKIIGVDGASINISKEDFSSGIYFYQLLPNNNNGSPKTGKFIIM